MIERLYADMKSALKAGDKDRLGAIRLLINAIKQEEMKLKRDLTEEEVISVLRRSAKQRAESVVEYRKAGREDLLEKELKEQQLIESYLPAMLSDEELEKLVREAIASEGVEDIRGLGKVMKSVMGKAGGLADGRRVQEIARSIIGD